MKRLLIVIGLLLPLTLYAPEVAKINKKNIEKAQELTIQIHRSILEINGLCADILFWQKGRITKGEVTKYFADSTALADSCMKHLKMKLVYYDSLYTQFVKLFK